MGIRNRRQEVGDRLGSKTLEAQFLTEACEGLNCSSFEAEAVLDLVKEVFGPYFGAAQGEVQPGKVTLVAVSAEEPAGKPLADCQKKTVCLTVHRGAQDDRLIHQEGLAAFRRSRIAAICQEALSQGALLTCEDLAYRVPIPESRMRRASAPTAGIGRPADSGRDTGSPHSVSHD